MDHWERLLEPESGSVREEFELEDRVEQAYIAVKVFGALTEEYPEPGSGEYENVWLSDEAVIALDEEAFYVAASEENEVYNAVSSIMKTGSKATATDMAQRYTDTLFR